MTSSLSAGPRPRRVCGAVFVVLAVLAVQELAGCNRGEGNAKDLAVSSDVEARAVIEDALRELAGGRIDVVLGRFCDQSEAGRALALELLEPAAGKVGGRPDLVIVRSEPAWVGAEPFFYVEVGERPAAGQGGGAVAPWIHGFGVRVRDGCLDRAVGATVLPKRPGAGPSAAGTSVPAPGDGEPGGGAAGPEQR